ncbi:MAG: hypothetical protein RR472_05360, partial [Anaerovoracaceae bacterium]
KSLAELFQSREGSAIYAAMARLYVPDKEVDQDLLYDLLEEDLIAVVKDIEEHILLAGNEEKVFADCMNKLGLSKLKEKEKLIIAKLSMADEDEHKTDIEQLTEELIKTQRMIQLGGKTN